MAAIFCLGSAFLAIAGVFIGRPYARRWIHGTRNANDMIGFSLQSFAALYGILLGLLAVEAYQDFSAVRDTVSRKALTFATLYHDIDGFPKPLRRALQTDLQGYAHEAIDTLWASDPGAPQINGPSPILHGMLAKILAFAPSSKSEEMVQQEAFRQVNLLVEQRRSLISSGDAGIPPALWSVVALGAFLFMLLMCLFEMELHVHLLLSATTALFLGAVVFLIAALDNPFRGGVTVDPAPLLRIRDDVIKITE
jgi:hypothetical protein